MYVKVTAVSSSEAIQIESDSPVESRVPKATKFLKWAAVYLTKSNLLLHQVNDNLRVKLSISPCAAQMGTGKS